MLRDWLLMGPWHSFIIRILTFFMSNTQQHVELFLAGTFKSSACHSDKRSIGIEGANANRNIITNAGRRVVTSVVGSDQTRAINDFIIAHVF